MNFRSIVINSLLALALVVAVFLTGTVFHIYRIANRVDGYLTVERVEDLRAAAVHSGDAAQITANTYSEVGYATRDVIANNLAPAVDEVRAQVRTMGAEFAETNRTLRREVAPTMDLSRSVIEDTGRGVSENLQGFRTNGDRISDGVVANLAATEKLVDGVTRMTSGPEVQAMVEDLAASGHRVRVIVEDPELEREVRSLFANSNRLVSASADITVELSGTAATVRKKVDETLYPPPAKGFWGKLGRGLKVASTYVIGGAQAGYYLLRIGR